MERCPVCRAKCRQEPHESCPRCGADLRLMQTIQQQAEHHCLKAVSYMANGALEEARVSAEQARTLHATPLATQLLQFIQWQKSESKQVKRQLYNVHS